MTPVNPSLLRINTFNKIHNTLQIVIGTEDRKSTVTWERDSTLLIFMRSITVHWGSVTLVESNSWWPDLINTVRITNKVTRGFCPVTFHIFKTGDLPKTLPKVLGLFQLTLILVKELSSTKIHLWIWPTSVVPPPLPLYSLHFILYLI